MDSLYPLGMKYSPMPEFLAPSLQSWAGIPNSIAGIGQPPPTGQALVPTDEYNPMPKFTQQAPIGMDMPQLQIPQSAPQFSSPTPQAGQSLTAPYTPSLPQAMNPAPQSPVPAPQMPPMTPPAQQQGSQGITNWGGLSTGMNNFGAGGGGGANYQGGTFGNQKTILENDIRNPIGR